METNNKEFAIAMRFLMGNDVKTPCTKGGALDVAASFLADIEIQHDDIENDISTFSQRRHNIRKKLETLFPDQNDSLNPYELIEIDPFAVAHRLAMPATLFEAFKKTMCAGRR